MTVAFFWGVTFENKKTSFCLTHFKNSLHAILFKRLPDGFKSNVNWIENWQNLPERRFGTLSWTVEVGAAIQNGGGVCESADLCVCLCMSESR